MVSNFATGSEEYIAMIGRYYGSIESRIEAVAIEKGFVTRNGTVSIEKLSAASGVSRSTLWYLLKDKEHFRAFNLVTMAKLCAALESQPGDLLRFVPGGSERGLGYSTTAFSNLLGTQNSSAAYDLYSESGGDDIGEERAYINEEE